jgi:Glycosyltransferase family 87
VKAKTLTTTNKAQQMRWYWWGLLGLLLTLASYALAVRMVNSIDYLKYGTDFSSFWMSGKLVLQGKNPYDMVAWGQGFQRFSLGFLLTPVFLYPLPLALLLAPLGWLPFHGAYNAWVTLSLLMIITSLVVLLRLGTNPRWKLFFIPLLVEIMLFRPTILTLTQGQVSGLFLFGLAWTAFLWQKGKWFWGGFLLGLLALKPNLGLILIVLVGIWLLLNKKWMALCGTLVSGILMLIAGLIYNPAWVTQYLQVGSTKLSQTFGGSPTVWGLGALISHNQITTTLVIGSLAGLVILFGFFWAILRAHAILRPVSVLALAVSVTLLVTPYTWTYDQLLLILPIVAVILAMDRMGARFLLSASFFLALDALVLILLFFNVMLQVEILNVLVPLIVFGLCLWYLTWQIPASA